MKAAAFAAEYGNAKYNTHDDAHDAARFGSKYNWYGKDAKQDAFRFLPEGWLGKRSERNTWNNNYIHWDTSKKQATNCAIQSTAYDNSISNTWASEADSLSKIGIDILASDIGTSSSYASMKEVRSYVDDVLRDSLEDALKKLS